MKIERHAQRAVVLAASAAIEVAAGHAQVSVAHIVGDVLEFGAVAGDNYLGRSCCLTKDCYPAGCCRPGSRNESPGSAAVAGQSDVRGAQAVGTRDAEAGVVGRALAGGRAPERSGAAVLARPRGRRRQEPGGRKRAVEDEADAAAGETRARVGPAVVNEERGFGSERPCGGIHRDELAQQGEDVGAQVDRPIAGLAAQPQLAGGQVEVAEVGAMQLDRARSVAQEERDEGAVADGQWGLLIRDEPT
jgi:hypothetical protein